MKTIQPFQKKIRKDLLSVDLPLYKLSLKLGASKSMATKWFLGVCFPSFKNMIRVCKTIHGENWKNHLVEYAELLDGEK